MPSFILEINNDKMAIACSQKKFFKVKVTKAAQNFVKN